MSVLSFFGTVFPRGGKKILDFYVKYFYVKSDLKFGSSMQKKFKLSVDKWIFRSPTQCPITTSEGRTPDLSRPVGTG